jgi:hypothetical protein
MPYTNYNWITDRLAIGGVVSDPEALPFDAILSLMTEAPAGMWELARSGNVEYAWFSIIDGYCHEEHDEIVQRFDAAAAQIHEWLSAGKRVLVHCYAGISRSVTAAVWYFVRYEGKTWDEAMEIIRASRTVARGNIRFEIPLRLAAGEDIAEDWLSERARLYCERVYADENFAVEPHEIMSDLERQGTTARLGVRR